MASNLINQLDIKTLLISDKIIKEKDKWTILFSREILLPIQRTLYLLNEDL